MSNRTVSAFLITVPILTLLTACDDPDELLDVEGDADAVEGDADAVEGDADAIISDGKTPDEHMSPREGGDPVFANWQETAASACVNYPSKANCDGQFASSAGCTGSMVKYTNMYYWTGNKQYIGRLELWWSNTCKTNWARINLVGSWPVTQLIIKRSSDGKFYSNKSNSTSDLKTAMVYSPSQSCAYVTVDEGAWVFGNAGWICM